MRKWDERGQNGYRCSYNGVPALTRDPCTVQVTAGTLGLQSNRERIWKIPHLMIFTFTSPNSRKLSTPHQKIKRNKRNQCNILATRTDEHSRSDRPPESLAQSPTLALNNKKKNYSDFLTKGLWNVSFKTISVNTVHCKFIYTWGHVYIDIYVYKYMQSHCTE